MKKLIITISVFVAMIFVFTGCEECIECQFTIPMLDIVETSEEQCGSSADVDDIEERWTQRAIDAGTTVTCTRN